MGFMFVGAGRTSKIASVISVVGEPGVSRKVRFPIDAAPILLYPVVQDSRRRLVYTLEE
jgi:hypothetical protein